MSESARWEFLGVPLATPIVVGSGLLTDQEQNIRNLLAHGAGAVVSKTIHPRPPRGLDERIARIDTGLLNSTTYSKRSVDHWCDVLSRLADEALPVIASIHADSPDEIAVLARQIEDSGALGLELGIACINEQFGQHGDTPERVAAFVSAARKASALPISVKLGVGPDLRRMVDAAIEGGVDAITLSDTLPGAHIDPHTGEPSLGGVYGYSGPGIKPLVVAGVWQLRQAGYTIPIHASGGVTQGVDVAEYLAAGANSVQVYSALHKTMADSLVRIVNEWMSFEASRGPVHVAS